MLERDPEGRPSKWVESIEPEFDATERDGWHALHEYEQSLCPQCNRPRIVCEDPDTVWNPQVQACQATAAQSMYNREWQKRHEDTKPDADHWHPADGSLVWVSDQLERDEEFATPSLPAPSNGA